LAQRRFELYGIDISVEGLRQTHRNLDEFDFKVNLVQSDMTNIPYKNSVFDSVICVYAIYHNTLENIRKTLAEIYRILNEGGFVYITFQSLRSYKYGKGRFVEVNTFVQDFPPEQDIPHHFSDEGEVQQLMQAFHIIKIELDEYKSENGRTHSHWQVLAEKEH
jgi:ubiquinone/menaquinone biosynthesis C-methylase UbiE